MTASLSSCTVVNQRVLSHFLWTEGLKTSEIYSGVLALRTKTRGLLHKGVLLLHDNVRPLHKGVLTLKQSGS